MCASEQGVRPLRVQLDPTIKSADSVKLIRPSAGKESSHVYVCGLLHSI